MVLIQLKKHRQLTKFFFVTQCHHLGNTQLPKDIRLEAQSISSVLEEHQEESPLDVCTHETSAFDMVPPATVAEEQKKDKILGAVYQYVVKGIKPKPSAIAKIPSMLVRKYLLQFNQLTLKKDVLYHLCNNNVKYHQLVLPQAYHTAVLQTIHDTMAIKAWMGLCL